MPTVFITGANRGIGFAFASQYSAAGWRVIAACRRPERAGELEGLARNNENLRIEKLDVTDSESLARLAGNLKEQAIDVLINCAGIYSGAAGRGVSEADESQTFGSMDAAAWDIVLRTNAIAPIMVTQALMPNIRLGKERKVVMISSMMGSIARDTSGSIAYRTSKAALNMGMRNIAAALKEEKITVVSFHPGWVKTDMGGAEADITAEESAAGMRGIIAKLTLDQSGSFLGYDGAVWPW
jgi:NAD(P)-dependent dehydrogenase (short-subunit alcohol dehydrogenase family)